MACSTVNLTFTFIVTSVRSFLLSPKLFSCFMCVYNFVSHIEGGTQAENIREQDAERVIWA